MGNIPKKIYHTVAFLTITAVVLIFSVLFHSTQVTQSKTITIPGLAATGSSSAKKSLAPTQLVPVWVKPGDTLEGIFAKLGIPKAELRQLLQLNNHKITHLHPQQKLSFSLDQQNRLLTLKTHLTTENILQIDRQGTGFRQSIVRLPIETATSYTSGLITSSFATAAAKAGLNRHLYQQLVAIFAGQINFRRSIHRGDTFSILYQEKYHNGQKIGLGEILTAELKTKKQTYRAIRFTDYKHDSRYYTVDGQSVETRFLRYPVQFKRISSHFSYRRLDPILHRPHPHLGVDLAAYAGTPIHSIGDGRVSFVGPDHGYGNAVKIRYDRHYSGLYAHMRNFARGLKRGQYVHKGQVIGYVGSTGWSTGPHLHFGFYVNGHPKDWLALKPPAGTPISFRDRQKFKATVNNLFKALQLHHDLETRHHLPNNSKEKL